MEARLVRAALAAAVLLISMGASYRTPNFVVETPDPAFAQQVGQAAEQYRRDLSISWLGKAMPNWSQPCPLTVRTGANLGAGGATTFVFDHGEVFGWRMNIQGSRVRVLDSVLPHEITHMIFASHFRQPLPRWADEGGATSVEHTSEKTKHRRMLDQFLRTGRGIAFNRMFAMREYPRDIMPLYAQGYSLAEFLIQRGGRQKYIEFVGDGLKSDNWNGALQQHYSFQNLGTLQNTWLAWVQQGWPQQQLAGATQVASADSAPPRATAALGRVSGGSVYERMAASAGNVSSGSPSPSSTAAATPGRVSVPNTVLANVDQTATTGIRPMNDRTATAAETLPNSGWRAASSASGSYAQADRGRRSLPLVHPNTSVAVSDASEAVDSSRGPASMADRPTSRPTHSQVSHPQGFEPPRQIVLEWTATR